MSLSKAIEQEKLFRAKDVDDWSVYQAQKGVLREKTLKAQADYDMTPAGMLELARRLGQDRNNKKSEYALRLTAAKESRRTALAAIGKEDAGDLAHERKTRRHSYKNLQRDFLPAETERVAMTPEEAQESLHASRKWVSELTADEIEALAWITSNGSSVINTYLSEGEIPRGLDNRELTVADMQKYVADGKSAIAKGTTKPVMLYHGEGYIPGLENLHRIHERPENRAIAMETLATIFPVGSTWAPERFLSTSYDSGIGCDFAHQDVVLEIRSKTHGPVAAISTWANREREAIVAPGTQFKVIAIHETVLYQQSRIRPEHEPVKQENKIVVQLEEI